MFTIVAMLLSCVEMVCPQAMGTMTVQAATKVKLNKSKATVYVGNTVQLKLKSVKASSVKWKSANTKLAKVSSSGKVTALKKGTVKVTATYQKKKYTCTVTVKDAKLEKKQLSLQIGQGYTLEVLNSKGKVKWVSSNPRVAKVNAHGFISPKSKGKTVISAKVGNSTYKCNLNVVNRFSETDFVFDKPDDEGYTNYIDYATGKPGWYWYFNDAATSHKCNRNINIGDSFNKFMKAYGYCEQYPVYSYDTYEKHFNNSAYPRTYVELDYKDGLTQQHYYKKFYFDRNGTLVLIIWHV